MINALRQGGTKSFILDDVSFGWSPIISMYGRECDRVKKGLARMIPIHILRDAWTKLNVTPAKIMQVC